MIFSSCCLHMVWYALFSFLLSLFLPTEQLRCDLAFCVFCSVGIFVVKGQCNATAAGTDVSDFFTYCGYQYLYRQLLPVSKSERKRAEVPFFVERENLMKNQTHCFIFVVQDFHCLYMIILQVHLYWIIALPVLHSVSRPSSLAALTIFVGSFVVILL